MYRLLSSVTARAAAATGPAWSGGRRGAHGRPGHPVLGLGWAGGLGLGLGLALGAKLAVGLRGAGPTQSPADPEAAGAELPHEQALSLGSPHSPASPAAKGFSRAIESSRDLLHRIKVRAQRTPGLRLPRKTSRFPTARPRVDALGVAQVAAEVTGCGGDRPFPFREKALSTHRGPRQTEQNLCLRWAGPESGRGLGGRSQEAQTESASLRTEFIHLNHLGLSSFLLG